MWTVDRLAPKKGFETTTPSRPKPCTYTCKLYDMPCPEAEALDQRSVKFGEELRCYSDGLVAAQVLRYGLGSLQSA